MVVEMENLKLDSQFYACHSRVLYRETSVKRKHLCLVHQKRKKVVHVGKDIQKTLSTINIMTDITSRLASTSVTSHANSDQLRNSLLFQ